MDRLDEINAKIGEIHERLGAIAKRTANMAWVRSANDDNPAFRELMAQHSRLLQAADKLIDEAEKLLGMTRP